MFTARIATVAVIGAAAIFTTSCASYGTRYGGGYSSATIGYSSTFGNPYWGWYGDYYYPGTGVYVYTRDRNRLRWTHAQRRYWEGRRSAWRGDRRELRDNWRDFRQDRRADNRDFRRDRRSDRRAYRRGEVTRPEFRAERRRDTREYRRELRRDRRDLRRQNRRDRRDP